MVIAKLKVMAMVTVTVIGHRHAVFTSIGCNMIVQGPAGYGLAHGNFHGHGHGHSHCHGHAGLTSSCCNMIVHGQSIMQVIVRLTYRWRER